MKYLFIFSIFLPLIASAQDLHDVTVRNSSFEVIKSLNSPTDLKLFSELWEKRIKVECNEKDLKFKLHISPGDRWRYSIDGCVRVLTMKAGAPSFRIPDVVKFNNLLGITKDSSASKL